MKNLLCMLCSVTDRNIGVELSIAWALMWSIWSRCWKWIIACWFCVISCVILRSFLQQKQWCCLLLSQYGATAIFEQCAVSWVHNSCKEWYTVHSLVQWRDVLVTLPSLSLLSFYILLIYSFDPSFLLWHGMFGCKLCCRCAELLCLKQLVWPSAGVLGQMCFNLGLL